MLTRFQCYFIKREITLKWKIIRLRKQYGLPTFLWGIHIWNFNIFAYMVVKLCYAQESVTNERTNEWTNQPTRSNKHPPPPPPTNQQTPHFFLGGGGAGMGGGGGDFVLHCFLFCFYLITFFFIFVGEGWGGGVVVVCVCRGGGGGGGWGQHIFL